VPVHLSQLKAQGGGLSDVFISVMVMVFEEHSYLFTGYTKFFDVHSNVYNTKLCCVL